MLTIRRAQMDVLGLQYRSSFEAKLSERFIEAYPRETAQAGGPPAMQRWTHEGVAASIAAGYASQRACGRWLLLAMMLGFEFAKDPQLPWMRDCLDLERHPSADERMDAAFAEGLHYLGVTAGEHAERVVRAMLRIREFDFASVPDLEGSQAVDDACERLAMLYPEKFAYQGRELTGQIIAQQFAAAHSHGLDGPAGRFLYVVLVFMLGVGFARDPLHPWAGEILASPAGEGQPDRGRCLEAAARAHMARSMKMA
jgi:hypothetical protein